MNNCICLGFIWNLSVSFVILTSYAPVVPPVPGVTGVDVPIPAVPIVRVGPTAPVTIAPAVRAAVLVPVSRHEVARLPSRKYL